MTPPRRRSARISQSRTSRDDADADLKRPNPVKKEKQETTSQNSSKRLRRGSSSKISDASTSATAKPSTVASKKESRPSVDAPVAKKPDKVIYPASHSEIPFEDIPLSNGNLRIVSWNVASFRAVEKSGALRKYLDEERPHIICIQETKMNPQAESEAHPIPGYSIYWNHSERKGHFGVATFIRDDAKSHCAPLSVTHGIGDPTADAEGRIMTLTFPPSLCLVNAYVPNAGGKLARLHYRTEVFEPALRRYLEGMSNKHNVIYCGDLNVAHSPRDIHDSKGNVKNAGHTPEERLQFSTLLKDGPGWVDCFRTLHPAYPGYTFYSKRFGPRLREQWKGWRLDYFLLDQKTYDEHVVKNCFVRPDVYGSDHYPLVLDLDYNTLVRSHHS